MTKAIEMSVMDRIQIKALFPEAANMLTLAVMKDIAAKTELSQIEVSEIGLKQEGNRIVWDSAKAPVNEIEFSDAEISFLKKRIDELDSQNKIQPQLYDICLKIKS